jgi:hypothetical protein
VLRICAEGGNVIHGSFAFSYEWKNRFGKKRKKERVIKRKKEGKTNERKQGNGRKIEELREGKRKH